ncbi:MAG: GGDEF domain-containing protein [Nitrospinaceae bacterium]|jgi:diguanylate cyclase (GGDEF)-like protein|nr:GGDEF domain-containing protein [Nitrospinaceae bacterium]MBT3432463.1 GGDEF domain-containing protein [Nitrospinaceae bacterium]MBT3823129.1 GGDEF domain-containing protein [Nitrospinaceae bacterium]MBT4093629.1 GGDEF domain-containing protein [Nitrospinaceae bacterium]MBT4431191.1 GGDEF domain-containing protein [Nitrospinaceae bacterium]
MADMENLTGATDEDAWPVSESESEAAKENIETNVGGEDDKGEFLLNLLSPYSRHRLLPLSELPREELIHAFLGGGIHVPRVMAFYLPENEMSRLVSLMTVPISEHYETVTLDNLHEVSSNPPHMLLVHLENSGDDEAEKIVGKLMEVPTMGFSSVVAIVKDETSPYIKEGPPWAQTVLPLTLEDQAFRRHLKNLLDLARARMDLETIYLAHRVSREQLHAVQYTDPLTGLLNRRGFEDSGARELSRTSRTGQLVGLVIIDIDKFKNINDTYGHPAGDSVLRQLAQILREQTRTLDHVFRFGGEEFGILLPHTPKDEMIFVCERIRRVVEEMHFSEMPKAGSVTISLGALSVGASRRPRLEDVYPVADELLYEAKQSGRNRVISGDYE